MTTFDSPRSRRPAGCMLAFAVLLAAQAAQAQTAAGDAPAAPAEGAAPEAPAPEAPPAEAPAAPDAEPAPAEAQPPPAPDAVAPEGEATPAETPEPPPEEPADETAEPGVQMLPPPELGAVEPAPLDEEEILVTGSRIKRTSFSQPSAVQVMTRGELEQSGADNMADVVRYLSINSGSELNTDVSTAAGGTAQFNLRGLGLNSTLVLLNGRRLVNAATISTDGTNFVDINTIPLAAIERVEILKGGASAIYGSDAVAGVVNMITRKDMDGFEAQIGGQTTDDLDQHEWDMSLVGGAQGEKTRVNAMVSYFKREPLKAEDRDFTENGRNVSLLGQPGAFVRINQFGMEGGGVFTEPSCGEAPLSEPQLDELSPITLCTFNFNPYMMLMINEQRINTYATIEHDISHHTRAFVEAGYATARSFRSLSPSFPILQPIIIPIDNPYNVVGNDLRWVGRTLGGAFPPTRQFFESDTLHTVIGLAGDFGGIATNTAFEDWDWELAGTFSRNQFRFGLTDALTDELQDAVNCDEGEDPADCWNPFYDGPPNTQEQIEAIHGELRSRSDTELRTINAGLTGPVLELPGGDLGLAVGAQLRQETARADLDHDANQLNYIFLIGGPDYQAERDILAAYGELVIPAAEGLELQAALRFEDYDDVGNSVDPKIGVSFNPATTLAGYGDDPAPSNIRLRGTYATSFRAPTLLQMNGAQTEIAETFDVMADGDGNPVRAPRSIYRAVRTLGSQDLKPETSAAITAGVEWKPTRGLTVELDYFRYDFEDLVVKQSHQQLIDADYLCDVTDPTSCDDRITRDPMGSVQQVDTAFVNAPSVITDGLDFGVRYRSDFGADAGTFSLATQGSYLLSYDIELEPGGEVVEAAGNRNFANPARPMPRVRINVPLGWSYEGHGAALVAHFIGGYDNDDPTRENDDSIDPWLTLDLQYSFRLDEGDGMATTFKVGLLNVLDSDPPAVDAGYGYDVFVHDPRGRIVYGRLIQEL